jgi:hypothetical protein
MMMAPEGQCGRRSTPVLKALNALAAEGDAIRNAVNDAALTGLSPYQTEHINRFGI